MSEGFPRCPRSGARFTWRSGASPYSQIRVESLPTPDPAKRRPLTQRRFYFLRIVVPHNISQNRIFATPSPILPDMY